jgi:hypothetical protein
MDSYNFYDSRTLQIIFLFDEMILLMTQHYILNSIFV